MKILVASFVLVLTLPFLSAGRVYPQEAGGPSSIEKEKEIAKAPIAWDLGPDTVDISGYPPDIQSAYKVFAEKCGSCHTLARALNTPFATPEEWNRYVNKMMRKPGSGISPQEAKEVFRFLVHDSKVRKLSDPKAWEKHIQGLLDTFQEKYGKGKSPSE